MAIFLDKALLETYKKYPVRYAECEYYYLAIIKDGELHTVWLNSKGECEDKYYRGCYDVKLNMEDNVVL